MDHLGQCVWKHLYSPMWVSISRQEVFNNMVFHLFAEVKAF